MRTDAVGGRGLWRAAVALGAAAALGVGCSGDPSGPDEEPELTVILSVTSVTGPTFSTDSAGNPLATCIATIRATATGNGNAQWTGYTLRLLLGPDRSTPQDSLVGNGVDARSAWGFSSISADSVLDTSVQLSVGLPYTAELEFRYRIPERADSGHSRAIVRYACEPDPAETAAPALSQVTFTNAAAVQPGDSLRVQYRAEAGALLWQTGFRVSSTGCEVDTLYFERTAPTVVRSTSFVLPWQCRAGDSLSLEVVAVDSRGRVSTSRWPIRIPVIDTVPPTMAPAFEDSFGPTSPTPIGDHFVGEPFRYVLGARDNGGLDYAVLEDLSSGERDSVRIAGSARETAVRSILLTDAWLGRPHLRARVVDLAKNSAVTRTYPPSEFRIHPTLTLESRSVQLPRGTPLDLVVSSRHNVAIVLTNVASILDLSTGAVVRTLSPAGLAPLAMDLSLDESTLYLVTGDARLHALPLATPLAPLVATALPGLDSNGEDRPIAMRVTASGSFFMIVTDVASGARRWYEADVGANSGVGLPGPEPQPVRMIRSRDGRRVAVHSGVHYCVTRWLSDSRQFGPGLCTLFAGPPAVGEGSDFLFANSGTVSGEGQVLAAHRAPSGASMTLGIAADPTGEFVVRVRRVGFQTPARYSLVRTRVADGAIVDRALLPDSPALLEFVGNGSRLVTVTANTDSVLVRILTWP